MEFIFYLSIYNNRNRKKTQNKNSITMVKCQNVLAVFLALGAIAVSIISIIMEWKPKEPLLQAAIEKEDNYKLWSLTLPIISTACVILATGFLILDIKKDKMLLRFLAISGFLVGSAVMFYAAGSYTKLLVDTAGMSVDELAQKYQGHFTNDELEKILGTVDEDNTVIENLNIAFGFFDSFSDLGVQWGFAVALAGGLCDLIVAGFYACMSCCGLC